MSDTPYHIGAYVSGATASPRILVRHSDILNAYADGDFPNDNEAYLSQYVFGPEMREHYRTNRNSVAGFAGPCCCRWLILDIDRANLDDALADARKLSQTILQRYPEVEGQIPIYFSGSKGFHILVELTHEPPPIVGFPQIARTFAETLADIAGVKIDAAIYDINHIVRLPNTRHPRTGLFKRRIDFETLIMKDMDAIREFSKRTSGDGIPTVRQPVKQLADDWQVAERETARRATDRAAVRGDFGSTDARAPKYFMDLLRFGVPEGERHHAIFRSAAWLTEQGAPASLCKALITEAALDVGLTPNDAERQIQCGIEYARKQGQQRTEGGPSE